MQTLVLCNSYPIPVRDRMASEVAAEHNNFRDKAVFDAVVENLS